MERIYESCNTRNSWSIIKCCVQRIAFELAISYAMPSPASRMLCYPEPRVCSAMPRSASRMLALLYATTLICYSLPLEC